MTEEKQKSDLGQLSSTWHERVKNIRVMAKKCEKDDTEYFPETPKSANTTETPSDDELFTGTVNEELFAGTVNEELFAGTAQDEQFADPAHEELFAGTVHEELSAQQVFAGNEVFYQSLENDQTADNTQSLGAEQIPMPATEYKRFSFIQKAIAAAIVLIASVMLYGILMSTSEPARQIVSEPLQTKTPETPVTEDV